jgi:hypothetical protein
MLTSHVLQQNGRGGTIYTPNGYENYDKNESVRLTDLRERMMGIRTE